MMQWNRLFRSHLRKQVEIGFSSYCGRNQKNNTYLLFLQQADDSIFFVEVRVLWGVYPELLTNSHDDVGIGIKGKVYPGDACGFRGGC